MSQVSKLYSDNIEVDRSASTVKIVNHDGSAKGLILGSTLVTATAAEINALAGQGAVAADLAKLHAITATAANINAVANAGIVSITAAGALSQAANAGRINVINSAAGIAITLPAATGTGAVYDCYIGTSITSLATTITAAGSDKLSGSVLQTKSDSTFAAYYFNPASSTAVSMDGSTKGGVKGDRLRFVDIASGLWSVNVQQSATGTVASPVV